MPRVAAVALAVLAVHLALAAPVPAQRQPLPPPGQAGAVAEGASPSAVDAALAPLLVLPGTWVEVRYPADTLDRAARVQARLETLHDLWQPISQPPIEWRAAAVTEEIWNELATGRPWGMPARLDGLFVVPAYGDAGTVATSARLLGGAPFAAGGVPVLGTAEEAGASSSPTSSSSSRRRARSSRRPASAATSRGSAA